MAERCAVVCHLASSSQSCLATLFKTNKARRCRESVLWITLCPSSPVNIPALSYMFTCGKASDCFFGEQQLAVAACSKQNLPKNQYPPRPSSTRHICLLMCQFCRFCCLYTIRSQLFCWDKVDTIYTFNGRGFCSMSSMCATQLEQT